MSFSALGLPAPLVAELSRLQINAPFPIQEQAIPVILVGSDVLGIAPTGSGKTASFALPILTNLQKAAPLKNRHIGVLVLVPTRELAMQVGEVFEQFGKVLSKRVKSLAVFGGVSINPQMMALQDVEVLIATPGRLLDLHEQKALNLSSVHTLVLDEADKMLNLGFQEEMERIFMLLPVKKQNLLFSATLTPDVTAIHQLLLHEPVVIEIEAEQTKLDQIRQTGYWVAEDEKGPFLRKLITDNTWKRVLVFTSSSRKADNVALKLTKNKIDAVSIHGKKSQGARTEALSRFKSGQLKVLVTTDVLARGIDVEHLDCVINYELPRSPQDYVHRIGRTGRAEATGEAISLVTAAEAGHFKVIQKKMGIWVVMRGNME